MTYAHLKASIFKELTDLLARSAVISLHVPLTAQTKHLINKEATIALMKDKVMLLNTSRGSLISTPDVVDGLASGKIGYLGLDVYEFEKGLFFENHSDDPQKDELLRKLMAFPNVPVTPHQAFLTHEALQQIACKRSGTLTVWQQNN
jgi:D-lactate dehydrogenase